MRSSYAYPLTIYLIPLLVEKDKNNPGYSFYNFIKASTFLLLYTNELHNRQNLLILLF
jgi:hypothetical protein